MQIIYEMDRLFIVVVSSIILGTGVIFSFAASNYALLGAAVIIEVIYLYFSLKGPLKRARGVKHGMPDAWRPMLLENSLFYRNLDEAGKERFERDILIFLSDFSIEGVRREPVDMQTKLLVAAAIASVLHGRPGWEPPIKDGVLIYPGSSFNRNFEIGRGTFAGMATQNSPLIVTADSLERSFMRPDDGYNVVIHELGHYFDFEDGSGEGVPTARLTPDVIPRWREVIDEEWQRALNGDSFLDPYSGLNEAEFFACAVESFFENPWVIEENNPELYGLLKDFFNLDTLEILGQN